MAKRRGTVRAGGRTPRSRAVFWRRRLLAVAALALLAWGVVWGGGRLFTVLREAWETAVAEQQVEATAAPTAQPLACAPDALEWMLDHDARAAGSAVSFQLTVTNRSAESCLVDAGAQTLVLRVVSGNDPIWSNADCGAADPVRLLLGPEDSTTRTVTWGGARSAPACAAVEAPVLPGTYQVGLTYAAVEVPQVEAVFTLR